MINKLFNLILLFLLNLSLFSCINASPCNCWKYTEYQRNKQSCIDAAYSMGLDEWDRKVKQCTDYSELKDEANGYVIEDMVTGYVINEQGKKVLLWKTAYVKK